MDPNYRASEQQWSRVEGMGIRHRFAGCECILELRARIEALEAAQQPDQITYEPEWQQLSEREPQDGDRCAYRVAPRFTKELGTWSSVVRRFWASDKGLFCGDPECISWRIAMPHEITPATEESSATAPPAPAGELLGRAAKALSELNGLGLPPELWKSEAITVIRVIVAWMKEHNRVGSADLLEQEIKQ